MNIVGGAALAILPAKAVTKAVSNFFWYGPPYCSEFGAHPAGAFAISPLLCPFTTSGMNDQNAAAA